ncbi:cullin-5 [Drosophila grimshawi]|uniref:Cullin-5 n=1 Tax=Drosophila grimshawi TaxID=7222 RepID=B4JH18_DROGR|nr:cullin-5 [Drosophila grimshawi]EDV92709.1 GH18911 [Drosophila grimshawi]
MLRAIGKRDRDIFDEEWPEKRKIVLKLLRQETVSQLEWQDLFYGVHNVCLWDEKGATKIYDGLQQDIVQFIVQAQSLVQAQRGEQALLATYIVEWRKFFTQSNYLPLPFRQLEQSPQVKPPASSSASSSSAGASTSNSAAAAAASSVTAAGAAAGASSSSSSNQASSSSSSTTKASTSSAATTTTGGGGGASTSAGAGSNSATSASNSSKKGPTDDSPVRKLMLDSWNKHIFHDIKDRLQESAMKIVHAERNGDAYDAQLVVGVRESYVNLSSNSEDKLEIYREHFEKAYLKATADFYRLKSAEQQQENGVLAYMKYADAKLREEEVRAKRYLEPSSFNILTCRLVKVLIVDHLNSIIAECPALIRDYETERLNLMFRLMDRVLDGEGVEAMMGDLQRHIKSAGLADMQSASEIITQDSEKYVERLLELFNKFSDLVRNAFNDDPRFLTARDIAFKMVVNDTSVFKMDLPTSIANRGVKYTAPESKCPELLANYCDMLLRRTPLSKRLTSEQIDARLRDVLLVLKYVNNKDVFMRYHKVHLTRRLILGTSADSEKEEDIVEWLREVGMPADYVNRLARMFQDIKVSEDLNTQFRNSISRHDAINIKILNAGAWARCSERVSVSLPIELEDYIPDVEEFYKKKHSGRKLQWYHHMSNGTITFVNNFGRYDLDVTTFQMAVLFAWNQRQHDKISYENLRLATELPDPELRRTLWSLVAFPKIKKQILLMEPTVINSPKDFAENTMFYINQEFAIVKNGKSQRRGKLNLIGRLQLSTERSQQEDNQSIVQLRILRTQEAIIKIMKVRKRMNNAALQAELIDILKNMFLPSKKMIKEQLEWLIEHKYMRRDDDDINMFIYVA